MSPWRIDATVLTDLSASMFSACFVVLLVFLQLAQQPGPPPPPQPIEATRDLAIVRQAVPSPAGMVGLLHAHGSAGAGPGLDLFDDRVELRPAGGEAAVVLAAPSAAAVAAALPGRTGGPVRLYVFSHAHYAAVSAALSVAGLPRQEMSVPLALRDARRPMAGWSADFLELDAERLDAAAFRRRLAALLAAADDGTGGAAGAGDAGGTGAPPPRTTGDLLARLGAWLAFLGAVLGPLGGLAIVCLVERGRWKPAVTPGGADMDRPAASL